MRDFPRRDQQPMRGTRSNYIGRGSTDNRPQMADKRSAAVVASSLTATQGFKKDTDLRKVIYFYVKLLLE